MRFIERLRAFMYGRYGIDDLAKAMLFIYVVLAVVNIFVRSLVASAIITWVQLALLLLMVLRFISKNFTARRRENEIFLKLFMPLVPHINMLKNRLRDIKYKRYRTCPNCKSVSRLPIKRGRHTVRCPKCRIEFKVFILI